MAPLAGRGVERLHAQLPRQSLHGVILVREGEQADPLLLGLDDLTRLDQLGQQGGALLTADAHRRGDVTALGARGVGQEVLDLGLDALVLALLLGGLADGAVALLQRLAQGDELLHMVSGDALEGLVLDGGQDGIDGGNVGDLGVSHGINPFWFLGLFLVPFNVVIVPHFGRFVKGFFRFFSDFFQLPLTKCPDPFGVFLLSTCTL